MKDQALDSLWLARAMYDLGAVTFGDFTLGGSTINSPVFINPRAIIGNPTALAVAARLMYQEVTLAQSLRRAKAHPYEVVAGVPVGGLLLATAYSLESGVPLIYSRQQQEGTGARGVEGRYQPGARALLVDDIIAGGRSVTETARFLAEHDVIVHDAVVLVDREMGARQRLKQIGVNLISIIKLDVMMNLYQANGLISEEQYERYQDYVRANRAAQSAEDAADEGPGAEAGAANGSYELDEDGDEG